MQGAPSFSNSFENSAGGLPSQSFSVRQTLSISAWQGVRVAYRVAKVQCDGPHRVHR